MTDRRTPRELRRAQTRAERAAWHLLCDRRLDGLKFRRQSPLGPYVVDFYCWEYRLAVDLDGSVHSQASQVGRDRAKERYLEGLGVRTLRAPNDMVLHDSDLFVRNINEALPSPVPLRGHPLPKARAEKLEEQEEYTGASSRGNP